MENLPSYVSLVFVFTVLLTAYFFYRAADNSQIFLILVLSWAVFQSLLGISGFYKNTSGIPPRIPLLFLPPIILIILCFITSSGKKFIDHLNIKTLTLLHIIRLPVEIVLFLLFLNKSVPELITFEGRNFDIFSGLSALIIYDFAFVKKNWTKNLLLIWNFICLGLLLNVITYALLSARTPIQKFGFDQPNIAVQYFPFVFLPSVVVPLVLFAHLAAIRQILLNKIPLI